MSLFWIVTFQVTHEKAKCIRMLPAHSYTAVGFNSGLITIFTFVLESQGFGKVRFISSHKVPQIQSSDNIINFVNICMYDRIEFMTCSVVQNKSVLWYWATHIMEGTFWKQKGKMHLFACFWVSFHNFCMECFSIFQSLSSWFLVGLLQLHWCLIWSLNT